MSPTSGPANPSKSAKFGKGSWSQHWCCLAAVKHAAPAMSDGLPALDFYTVRTNFLVVSCRIPTFRGGVAWYHMGSVEAADEF